MTHLLLSRLQVLLQLLLDHLVGHFYGLVLGGLTISDGVRHSWVWTLVDKRKCMCATIKLN